MGTSRVEDDGVILGIEVEEWYAGKITIER
jgi:hypothetical protein